MRVFVGAGIVCVLISVNGTVLIPLLLSICGNTADVITYGNHATKTYIGKVIAARYTLLVYIKD